MKISSHFRRFPGNHNRLEFRLSSWNGEYHTHQERLSTRLRKLLPYLRGGVAHRRSSHLVHPKTGDNGGGYEPRTTPYWDVNSANQTAAAAQHRPTTGLIPPREYASEKKRVRLPVHVQESLK